MVMCHLHSYQVSTGTGTPVVLHKIIELDTNITDISGHFHVINDTSHIQGVSGGRVNILGGGSMDHSQ